MQTDLTPLEDALRERMQSEERQYTRESRGSDSLWDHSVRVAILAERLGRDEGVDALACRIAGLFHDAGKFAGGRYHEADRPEEERSVDALNDLVELHPLPTEQVDQVADSIRQLYRDDPDPTPLTCVLFDADNLDKLGPLGIANYFVKTGLRGRGVSRSLLFRLTVELTYARHASRCLLTESGRALAEKRAPETIRFLHDFLDTVREDGLYDFQIETVVFDKLELDVVSPKACDCGAPLSRRIWEVPGIKCSEIHLEHACAQCDARNEIRFCRPRLIT